MDLCRETDSTATEKEAPGPEPTTLDARALTFVIYGLPDDSCTTRVDLTVAANECAYSVSMRLAEETLYDLGMIKIYDTNGVVPGNVAMQKTDIWEQREGNAWTGMAPMRPPWESVHEVLDKDTPQGWRGHGFSAVREPGAARNGRDLSQGREYEHVVPRLAGWKKPVGQGTAPGQMSHHGRGLGRGGRHGGTGGRDYRGGGGDHGENFVTPGDFTLRGEEQAECPDLCAVCQEIGHSCYECPALAQVNVTFDTWKATQACCPVCGDGSHGGAECDKLRKIGLSYEAWVASRDEQTQTRALLQAAEEAAVSQSEQPANHDVVMAFSAQLGSNGIRQPCPVHNWFREADVEDTIARARSAWRTALAGGAQSTVGQLITPIIAVLAVRGECWQQLSVRWSKTAGHNPADAGMPLFDVFLTDLENIIMRVSDQASHRSSPNSSSATGSTAVGDGDQDSVHRSSSEQSYKTATSATQSRAESQISQLNGTIAKLPVDARWDVKFATVISSMNFYS